MTEIRRGLDAEDSIFIAHNPALEHFVLFTQASWINETFSVHDPFYNVSVYNFDETSGFLQYKIYGIAREYPFYSQCNISWSNETMGENNKVQNI